MRWSTLLVCAVWAFGLPTQAVAADKMDVVCDTLELAEDDLVIASVKYKSTDARNAVWSAAERAAHIEFISRVVAQAPADRLWPLCEREDITHIEIIAKSEADSALHRILELWRIHHYVVGGRFDVSAFNFSQGVRKDAIGQSKSAEQTIAEALDSISRRIAPVFVAAGNTGSTSLDEYAGGRSVFPVVATEAGGSAIFPGSSRPGVDHDTHQLFLLADGAPRPPGTVDAETAACESSDHLTVGQMLQPESAGVDPGGSSFATFAATAAACPVHQYLQVMNAYLSAGKPVGDVQVDPFIAYYVDNPISPDCPALENRLADKRRKYAPIYHLSIPQKRRIQDMFFGNSMVFNLRYSTPVLRSFFRSVPERPLAQGFEGAQHYVSQRTVLERLSEMTFADWIKIGANSQSLYYQHWLQTAAKDSEPVLPIDTIRTIAGYCRMASLFIVLSDDPPSPFGLR